MLWLPAALACGAAAYVGAEREPNAWLAAAGAVAFFGLALALRRWGAAGGFLSWLCALACAAAIGMGAGAVRAQGLTGPHFLAPFGPGEVVGVVERIDAGSRAPRLVIRVERLAGVAAPALRVRLSTPEPLSPGRRVRCFARLAPPEPPSLPGGFDPQRRAYFERIAASGFSLGRCRPLPAEAGSAALPLDLRIAAWRRDLTEAIAAAAPGRSGALAAALVTGDRSLISNEVNEAFRDSGLAHLLSVSGLHMAVVAGLVYAMLHFGLALAPGLALVWPIRKIAAATAIAAAAAYLVISGGSLPAQRAFVMASVVLGAVLIDRPAISMRGLAAAAVILLLWRPEAALDPGFQMSFAATAALIALYEELVQRSETLPSPGWIVSALRWTRTAIWTSALTSLVAGLATDPIALHHFQRFAIYGLPANMAAAPLITVVIAPAAMAAAVLAPFGLAEAPLQIMAAGLDQIAAIADAFGSRPEAVRAAPAFGEAAFALALFAAAWACLWRGRLRWLAVAPAAAAAFFAFAEPRPLALATPDGRHVLARVEEAGRADWRWIAAGRGGRIAAERLATRAGLSPAAAKAIPAEPVCAPGDGCAWRAPGGRRFAFEPNPERLAAACAGAERVIHPAIHSATPAADPELTAGICQGKLAVVDARRGGLVLSAAVLSKDLVTRTGRTEAYQRPWGRAAQ